MIGEVDLGDNADALVDKTELEEYQEFVASCPQPTLDVECIKYAKGWWAATQMTCEAGEVLTIFEKAIRKKKEVDLVHLEEELGDVLWGLAAVCNATGLSLDNIIMTNISKLRERYGTAKEA